MSGKLDERDALAAAYDAALGDIDGLTITNARHARHLYTVWLPEPVDRSVAVDRLKALGVSAIANYLPI